MGSEQSSAVVFGRRGLLDKAFGLTPNRIDYPKRSCVPLGTDNAAIAKRQLERIVSGEIEPGSAPPAETFQQAAERIVATAEKDPELLVLAIVSRCLGGMRTSDLHAWDWRHIDLDGWETAHVPRPKTKTPERHALPAELVPTLQGWWRREGQPRTGPVFPVRVGKRAGERKRGKISYAERLRAELLRAGLDRHELHHDTEHTRRVDFHSCRRAYATGLARAGVAAQLAMPLAGHRNM